MALATREDTPRTAPGRAASGAAEPLPFEAPFLAARIHNLNQAAAEAFLEAVGGRVTVPQLMVLWAAHNHPGVSQTRLTEATQIDRSTLADVVRRLMRSRLLKRHRTKDDARAYAVDLTDAGRALVKELKPLAAKADKATAPLIAQFSAPRS